MILSARPQTNVCLKPARLLKAEVEKKDADEGQDDDGDDDDGGGDGVVVVIADLAFYHRLIPNYF